MIIKFTSPFFVIEENSEDCFGSPEAVTKTEEEVQGVFMGILRILPIRDRIRDGILVNTAFANGWKLEAFTRLLFRWYSNSKGAFKMGSNLDCNSRQPLPENNTQN